MGGRKSLADSNESIDAILRKLELAMGSALATKLTPELNAAKSAIFAEVLDQASFDQLYEFANAPPALVHRASAEQSRRENEITAGASKVQAELMTQFGDGKQKPTQAPGEARSSARADPVGPDVATQQELRSQGNIEFTDAKKASEILPAREPAPVLRGTRSIPLTDAEIAKAVEQDARTWKEIRSQGPQKNGPTQSREHPRREANER